MLQRELQRLRAAARHIQGRRPGACHGHSGTRRRLPRRPAAGQVRQQVCAATGPARRARGSEPSRLGHACCKSRRLRQPPNSPDDRARPGGRQPHPLRTRRRVSKLFGSFAALRQVSVDLEPGRCYVLIGENGAGKSTLLRILAGLLRPNLRHRHSLRRQRAAPGARPHRLHEPRAHALRRAHRAGKSPVLRRSLSGPALSHSGRSAAPGRPRSPI